MPDGSKIVIAQGRRMGRPSEIEIAVEGSWVTIAGPRKTKHRRRAIITAGLALAGATEAIPLWIVALLLTGVGMGLGNTGSIGMLLEAVRPERIVTAMIVWSQIGIAGYLVGPVAAGAVADALGFAALGLVPLGAALLLLVTLRLGTRTSLAHGVADP